MPPGKQRIFEEIIVGRFVQSSETAPGAGENSVFGAERSCREAKSGLALDQPLGERLRQAVVVVDGKEQTPAKQPWE